MNQIRKILLSKQDKFIFALLFTLFFAVSFAEGSAFILNEIFPSHNKTTVSQLNISSSVNAPIEDFVFEEYEEDSDLTLFRIIIRYIYNVKNAVIEKKISNHIFEHFYLVVHPPLYDLFCNWKSFLTA